MEGLEIGCKYSFISINLMYMVGGEMLRGVQTGDGAFDGINPGGAPFDNLPSAEVAEIGFQILGKASRQ